MLTRISTVILLALAPALAASAAAQSTEVITLPPDIANDSWQAAHWNGPTKGKIYVVTVDQPNRRQSCHIQSFTKEKLVCSRALGGPRTYLPQQVAALILPGDAGYKIGFVLVANSALGAAIWGTVVLAAACPACAVVTGIAAFCFFSAAGAVLIGDDQPDRVLYLAPGQELSKKLGYVQR